ncbi:MAG: SDR family oxidoreductase [Meiothermus sp.]|uniref:SDR family oxidoreductase n=1 Tax=Meiothermus sp. TaxID=1955249 RepID=UPI0025F41329|nr:SDR family oxidoreductase [Meiothermus sp.]MCS7057498.1 SDR family oxidoreductase [Meiothermus sp.]MCS7195042.1 SDR family oxidoreductase [Meiothermus sp.]MCX7739580.1 SDR family oxidoreductase [Meiothermus sp.]MDW8090850.1 SDR family oxidoreductase [Meiothermus sp.]MDW8482455.1 SDR family oxidoreductase [Meiothermus sp.]
MQRLKGKVALVTAAGQGIGRATAERFIAEGAEVVATDLHPELLQGLTCRKARMDVLSRAEIEALVASLPRVDILFNCAGYVHHGTILECSDEDWEFSFALNVRSMFWTMRAVIPKMLEQGGGVILNISSAASSIKGVPNRFVYSATKAAVIGMTKAVAADYATRGIRANAICPGTVDTPSWRARVAEQARRTGQSEEEVQRAFVARQPMGRVGRPEEVAALAAYLASDEAAFTTGAVHLIDGGWAM